MASAVSAQERPFSNEREGFLDDAYKLKDLIDINSGGDKAEVLYFSIRVKQSWI